MKRREDATSTTMGSSERGRFASMPLNLKSLNRRQKYISSVSRVEGKSNAPPPSPLAHTLASRLIPTPESRLSFHVLFMLSRSARISQVFPFAYGGTGQNICSTVRKRAARSKRRKLHKRREGTRGTERAGRELRGGELRSCKIQITMHRWIRLHTLINHVSKYPLIQYHDK